MAGRNISTRSRRPNGALVAAGLARSLCNDRQSGVLPRFRPQLEGLEARALLTTAGAGVNPPPGSTLNAIGDVFVINMENHNFTQPANDPDAPEQILGNPAAPYINSLITPGNPNAAQVSYASDYHNVLSTPSGNNPSIHPSEPNLIWSESGVSGGITNDNDPYPDNIVNAPNLSGLLQQNGISWKSYQEDTDLNSNQSAVLPQSQWTVPLSGFSGMSTSYVNPYNGSNYYEFAPKHDGSLFFADTNGGENFTSSNPEVSHYAPLQQLATDLAHNTVGQYNVITPDLYNDMHDPLPTGFTYHGVAYTGDQSAVAQGDNFLSMVIPKIMASPAYQHNGVIVIWFDETEGDDPVDNSYSTTIPEIIISPLAKGNAYDSTVNYTHSSDLKTWQEVFDVSAPGGGFLGDANTPGTNDLSDMFVSNPLLGQKGPLPGALATLQQLEQQFEANLKTLLQGPLGNLLALETDFSNWVSSESSLILGVLNSNSNSSSSSAFGQGLIKGFGPFGNL